jgi:hypothetical protein
VFVPLEVFSLASNISGNTFRSLQKYMHVLATFLLQKLEEVAPSAVLYPALAERNTKTGTPHSPFRKASAKGGKPGSESRGSTLSK